MGKEILAIMHIKMQMLLKMIVKYLTSMTLT
jgi:hypothetical protein